MNVLYISTVFPSEDENSTIYTDLAETLVERGHSVTVVAADEKKKSTGTKLLQERGCTILRVRTGNMYDVGIVEKVISILSLESIMSAAMRKFLKGKYFDLILFEAPPVTLSGDVYKRQLMGILIGIVICAGLVVVQVLLDDSIKSEDDITRYLGIPTLAVIPDRKDYIGAKQRKQQKTIAKKSGKGDK